jgi:hypothetical protein
MHPALFKRSLRAPSALAAVAAAALVSAACTRLPAAVDAGPLPEGFVDLPHEGETLGKDAQIVGWALGRTPVTEVAIYADGGYIQSARLGLPRPDVWSALPNRPEAESSGWAATLRTDRLFPGPHRLLVQVRTRDGATRDIGSLSIQVKP